MKTLKAKFGPYDERPYYSSAEVEVLCRSELLSMGLLPSEPEPIRIERFVEKRFGISVMYEELPKGVLGWTEFGPKGVQGIVVSKALVESGSQVAEYRINTTLAHEAGHGLLHQHLFLFGPPANGLFDTESEAKHRRVLCREEQFQERRGYSGKWWELQANLAMQSLLLPTFLVHKALEPMCESAGTLGNKYLPRHRRLDAIRHLSSTFAVNSVVARIRLQDLYREDQDDQLTL